MSTITPFIKRMRTQGGTIYTMNSGIEDIGLNLNERNNIVKMSHYALLNIPSIEAPPNLAANRFNAFAIPGAFNSLLDGGSIKDGRVVIAESFQNYALNLEATLCSSVNNYNSNLLNSISERVFWKWLKETGAIRWAKDVSNNGYWLEETDTDSQTAYNSIVKGVGQISAGSVRTDTFGTYNETYVLVPTSYGQSKVYFKQVEDDNYRHGISITGGGTNILGRNTYTKPHPDGLDLKAYYDTADSSVSVNAYVMSQNASTGGYTTGWWWTPEGITPAANSYYTDVSSLANSGIYNTDLKYFNGVNTINFKRSNVDCMSIEFDLDNLKTLFSDPTLTFDKMAIEHSIDDTFNFNAILLYYSVYNKTADKVLAINLLGVMFLDAPSGNTAGYPGTEITLPSITKIQSGPSGFGTSYSFRLNIKSDSMMDDTQAIIYDESTSAQTNLENFTDVFQNLGKAVNILNQHTGTINFITEQYLDISSTQTDVLNQIKDLQYEVNDISRDITGTENTVAMFIAGDDPIGDSSIYMKNGKLGFFSTSPTYAAQFDVSVKVKDLIIENAIRDISGNILLGYGSPLQIGSSTNYRKVDIYTGGSVTAMSIDTSNAITINGNVTINGSINGADITKQFSRYIKEASLGTGFLWNAGMLDVSGGSGSGDVTKVYVDGSLSKMIREASLGTQFSWIGGKLQVESSTGGAVYTSKAYVDGSIAAEAAIRNANYWLFPTFSQMDTSINSYLARNASLGGATQLAYVNASLNAKANLAGNPAFTGFPTKAGELSEANRETKSLYIPNMWDIHNYVDPSISRIGALTYATNASTVLKADVVTPVFTTSFGLGDWKFELSGIDLILKYQSITLFKFTIDGSMLAAGELSAKYPTL